MHLVRVSNVNTTLAYIIDGIMNDKSTIILCFLKAEWLSFILVPTHWELDILLNSYETLKQYHSFKPLHEI